ncbi:MAG: putative Ig domain-containing protein [Nitrospirota bacterium]
MAQEVRYAQAVALTTTLRDALKAGTATVSGVGAVATAADERVRHVYDATGRLRYSVDATGAVNGVWYDAADRIVATRRFAQRLNPSLVADGITQGQIEGAMGGGAASDAVDLFVYDGAGRMRFAMHANGHAAAYPISVSVTETRYDGAGRTLLTQTYLASAILDIATAGRIAGGNGTVSDLAAFTTANAGNVQSQRNVYDAAGRLTFSIDGTGGYIRTWYDGAGRVSVRRAVTNRFATAGLNDATTVAQLDALVQWGATDDLDMYVYDAAGRLRYELQAVGAPTVFPFTASVTERSYDGAGRVLNTRAFASLMTLEAPLIGKLGTGTATDADFATFASANAPTAQSQRNVYDAAGRTVYTIDAIGAYVRTWYDGIGRATAVRRFATPANPATLGDATTVAQMDAQLVWTAADPTEYRAYDASGRVRITYNSLGHVTQIDYDGAGRAVASRSHAVAYFPGSSLSDKFFAGTASLADFATFTAANEATARVQSQVYDAAGRLRYSLARNAGAWTVGERQYDGAGRVTAEIAYGVTIAHAPGETEAQVGVALQAQLSTDLQVLASQRRSTRYLYDAAGQQRFVLDATDAVSEQRYDGAGRVVETRSYGVRPTNLTIDTATLTSWAEGQSSADLRRVSNGYDAAGRLTARTDALGHSETFAYDGAGRMTTRTDRAGAQWSYQYDSAGRKVAEISPQVEVFSVDLAGNLSSNARSLVTRYAYDALGQLIEKTENADTADTRVTEYVYDNRGHLIRTRLPDAGEIDPATGDLVYAGVRPTVETTWDALGRAVVRKDELGNYTYLIYDALGRVAYEVDQANYVTAYGYDAYGAQTALTRYATALNTNASAFSAANWQAGQAIGLAQMQGAGSLTPNAAADRTIATSYDQLGRKTQVVQSSVSYIRSNGTQATGSPTTTFAYTAYGEVAKESVLLEGTAGQGDAVWAHTWRYYDAAGRNTVTVDAEGHVTEMAYNATGEVVRSVEYARAISTAALGTTPPALPAAGDAVVGFDRETRFTYDVLGRKATMTVVRNHQRIDGSTDRLDATTTYGYDNEDRVVSVVEAAGTVTTTYNAIGQAIAVQEQARSVLVANADTLLQASASTDLESTALYEQRSPYSAMMYDAFGGLVGVRRYANGRVGTGPVVADNARDQLLVTRYLKSGKPGMSRDALGNAVYSRYDAAGNLTRRWSRLEGSEDVRDAMAYAEYSYDPTGRQLTAKQYRKSLDGLALLGTDQSETVQYNAFGEIVAKTFEGVTGTLTYSYDAAGRLVGDNANGANRTFGYNLAGHQVRSSLKVKRNPTDPAIDAVTRTVTDKLGRAVDTILPSHTDNAAQTSIVRRKYDRWGNVLQSIDARGYQTDYQYNDHNQVVREARPLVWVVGENGGGSWQRPVNQWYYDAQARLVATRDANGNLRTMVYNAVGQHVRTVDSFGNKTHHAYDIFGQQRLSQDALGYITFKDYDRNGRIVAIGDYLPGGVGRSRNVQQTYVLNQAGDRIRIANALGQTIRYDYDTQQRMIRSETAAGVTVQYGYDAQGRKILETNGLVGAGGQGGTTLTDRDGQSVRLHEMSWKYDAFGRATDHNNLDGRDSDYVYDALSGALASESASGGYSGGHPDAVKDIRYFPNGRIQQITETGGRIYRYEYDASGNRTFEETITVDGDNQAVHTITRTTWDSNNRIQRVVQEDVIANKRVFDLRYDYDANGNRRRVVTQSGYGENVDGIAVVNVAPAVVAPPADRGVKKGVTSEFRLLFSDVFRDADGDALTLTIAQGSGAALPTWLTASRDPQTGEIVFVATPAANAADSDLVVRLTAHETANPANTVSATFTVKVRANNGSVAVGGATTYNAKLGEVFGRDLSAVEHFLDIDVGDALALSVVGTLPAWLSVNTAAPGLVRLSGTPTTAGSASFTLRATDASGAVVDKTVTIVSAANLPPTVVAAPAPQDATINRSFAWTATVPQVFQDANGDLLQVTISGLPSWLTFQHIGTQSPPQLRVAGQVPQDAVDGQIYNAVLTATDTSGASVSTTLQVRVTTNVPPQPPQVANKIAKQGQAYSATLPEFFDENADPLTYSVANLPPGLSFNASTRQIVGTPTTAGNWTIVYTANDGRVSASATFAIAVEANNAPVAPTVGAQSGTRNTPVYLLLPAFTDPNGDALTYTASGLPPGLSFNAVTREITGTPTTAGGWTVTYTANDGRGGVTGITFAYTIANPVGNQAPVVASPLADQWLMGGSSFSFTFPANAFVDPEGQTLTYTKAVIAGPNAASWLNFNASTRTFSGTAPALLGGPWTVRVTATDPSGASVYDDFEIGVDTGEGSMAGGGESALSFEMGLSEETLTQGATQSSSAGSGAIPAQIKDEWYLYDSENRIKLSGGVLSGAAGAVGTTIQLATLGQNAESWERGYDAVGRLVLSYRRVFNAATQSEVTIAERTTYDLRGQRQYQFHQQIIGGGYSPDPGVSTRFAYDAAGRLTEVRSYYATGTLMPTPVTIEGEVQKRDVSGWLSGAQRMVHDADGRLRRQESLGRDETVPHTLSPGNLALQYTDLSVLELQSRDEFTLADGTPADLDDNPTAYDAAGRLAQYRHSAKAADDSWYTHTFSTTYAGWDGYLEKVVAGTSSNGNFKPTTNTLTYDAFGRLLKQQEHTEYQDNAIDDRIRVYSQTAEGQAQTRREGTWKEVDGVRRFVENDADAYGGKDNYGFVYSGGQQVAELRAGGKIRTGQAVNGILGVNGVGGYAAGGGTATVLAGETLRTLSQRVYGTQSLWYVLADANGLSDAEAALTAGHQLKAPSLGVNTNDAGTFKPYDPSAAIGSTMPSLPYVPPASGDNCMRVVALLVRVVAVVVTAWAPQLAWYAKAAIAATSEGAAQTAEIEGGWRSGYSGREIFRAAANAVAVPGMQYSSPTERILYAMAQAAGEYVTTYATERLLGNDPKFSFRAMASQAVAAGLTAGIFGDNTIRGDAGDTYRTSQQVLMRTAAFSWDRVAREALHTMTQAVVSAGIRYGTGKLFHVDDTRWDTRTVAFSAVQAGLTTAGVMGAVEYNRRRDVERNRVLAESQADAKSAPAGVADELLSVNDPRFGVRRDALGRMVDTDGRPIMASDAPGMGGMTFGVETITAAPSGQGNLRMQQALIKRLVRIQQLEAEEMAELRPGETLIEGISVSASDAGDDGTSRDLMDIIRKRAPQFHDMARYYDWVGRSNLHAIKYKGVQIPLTASPTDAMRIHAYNVAKNQTQQWEYLQRSYLGRTNGTPYETPRGPTWDDAGRMLAQSDNQFAIDALKRIPGSLANLATDALYMSGAGTLVSAYNVMMGQENWMPAAPAQTGGAMFMDFYVNIGAGVVNPQAALSSRARTATSSFSGFRAGERALVRARIEAGRAEHLAAMNASNFGEHAGIGARIEAIAANSGRQSANKATFTVVDMGEGLDPISAKNFGDYVASDPVAYRALTQLQNAKNPVGVTLDFGPLANPRIAGQTTKYFEEVDFTIFMRHPENLSRKGAVSTFVHESSHATRASRGLEINTQLDEYMAFRREELFNLGRRPTLLERRRVWETKVQELCSDLPVGGELPWFLRRPKGN